MSDGHFKQACRRFLRPIVRLLIRNGVTWAEWAETCKEVYVEVARSDYGLQGRPTNASRVAMLTGLGRREVSRVKAVLAGREAPEMPPEDRISQVLTGWHVDPDFVLDGRPALLTNDRGPRSMAALLKRYAGDLPHGALLKEMRELGLVVEEAEGFRAAARSYIRSAADPDQVRQAGIALHDHAATIVHNLDAAREQPPRFERMATRRRLDRQAAAAFAALVESRGQSFLEELDRWLAEHESSEAPSRPVRVGVGIYLIQNEVNGTQDDE